MKQNVTYDKACSFAIRIVKLYKHLKYSKKEDVMSKQLLRCGTSIGANVAEALFGISPNDFTNKLFIALKESSETLYWLYILKETELLTELEYESISADAKEIHALLTASCKTMKSRISKK